MTAMKRRAWLVNSSCLAAIASAAVGSLLPACESTSDGKDGGGAHGSIIINDANNYKATSSLTIPRVQTAPGVDLKICWGDMKKDFLCHDVVPATDINSLSFLQVQKLSEQQVESDLGTGQSFADAVIPRVYHTSQAPSATCTTLSAFALDPAPVPPKNPVIPTQDYTVANNKIYMVLFSTGTALGTGSKSMLFLEPTESSTVTTVNAVADSCSILDFKADISQVSIPVPANGPFVVDWGQLKTDGLQNEVLYSDIDKLQLGFYQNMTITDLEAHFLDLDRIATTFYELPLSGTVKQADLTSAATAGGAKFGGFAQTDGIWAVALRCGGCEVPAPVAVAILNPS
jgi:hypothetical protein